MKRWLLGISAIVSAAMLLGLLVFAVIMTPPHTEPTISVVATDPAEPTQFTENTPPESDPSEDTEPASEETSAPTEDTTPPTEEVTEPSEEATQPVEDTQSTEPVQIDLAANQAIVFDCGTETELYRLGEESNLYPASITKLFTAYVALQYLDPSEGVTAGEELEFVGEDSTMACIFRGQRVSVEMLVEGMLLPSGNDAAYILATAAGRRIVGDGSITARQAVSVFVDEMNAQAASLGMTGTHFVNPDGYPDDDHYSCLEDMVTIGRLAMENTTISRLTATSKDSVTYLSGQTNSWHNTNALIDPSSPFYEPTACGLKTGSSTASGNCLLSAFWIEDHCVIIGVFGCKESDERFADTLTLLHTFVKP